MLIDSPIIDSPIHVYPSHQTRSSYTAANTTNNTTTFAEVFRSETTRNATQSIDFTRMTRQEMFDWMNDQIRNGHMSLDESTPFLGMTVKISAATGQPVDMATDNTRINFIEQARSGIEGALSRNDRTLADRLQVAIKIMQRFST